VSDNITLPRKVAYEVPLHELLESVPSDARLVIDDADGKGTRFIPVGRLCREAATALRARLAEPRPEPFVIKHYTADLRPTIKGNGFDGLEIGESREEAEEFVAWVNARIAAAPAAPPEPVRHPGYVIGNHWLETAYERLCAGESEDAILEDYEVVREPRLRELRRDAERYERVRKWICEILRVSDEVEFDAAVDASKEPEDKT
jgi:hypothetical protein